MTWQEIVGLQLRPSDRKLGGADAMPIDATHENIGGVVYVRRRRLLSTDGCRTDA